MIVFEVNNCKVLCPDDAQLNMERVDDLTWLAKKFEKQMPGTEAVVDLITKTVYIKLRDNPVKKMIISIKDDSCIRIALRTIEKYNEMYNNQEGEQTND